VLKELEEQLMQYDYEEAGETLKDITCHMGFCLLPDSRPDESHEQTE
jgi:hypothetical protein